MITPRMEEMVKEVASKMGFRTEVSFHTETIRQALAEAHQAGRDEAVENLSTSKRWRKMLEGLGRGFVIYITTEEKELLLLSLREVGTLKEARQKTTDYTIKELQNKK